MKKYLVLASVLLAFFAGQFMYSKVVLAQTADKKVDICHWTESGNYTSNEVSINSVAKCTDVNGHAAPNHDGKDIIPSFTYETCTFAGQNLDKISWIANGCAQPGSSPTPTATARPTATATATARPTATATASPFVISDLRLTSMCWEGRETHKFRVRNSNGFSVDYEVMVVGVTGWMGDYTANPGDNFFTINGTYGQPNTTKIRWMNENEQWKETVKAVNQNFCASPTATPSQEPEATPTDGDICKNIDGIQTSVPEGKHQAGENCIEYALGGPPAPGSSGSVLGATSGQVLGANSMAGTGITEEAIFNLIFALGMGLTGFGVRKVSKSSVK